MSKNITKTLAATLAATLGAGIVPVMAQTSKSLDELHKAAYTAVAVAKKDKTQKSINDARVVLAEYKAAIEAEEKLGLLPNVNTFSVQLDEVQHPILSDIVKSILAIQKAGTATQAEINEVRTMLEGDQADETDDLPKGFDSYKKTWNADLDVYQTRLMDAAIEAVKTAETEKTQATVDAAKVLVADLATAVRPGIQKVATGLQARVEAVEVSELKITALNVLKDSVEVEFDAIKNTLTDVNIEVIDNNGKKIEVQPVAKMIEGKSKQKFEFKKIYATLNEKIEGVWTINGVKVDMTEKKLVNAVVTGKNADKDNFAKSEAMIILQNKSYISRLAGKYTTEGSITGEFIFHRILNADGQPEAADALYIEEISKVNGETPIKTAKDIQAVVDSVNKAAGIVADEKEIVDIIKESASKPVQFINALNAEGIESVNESFVATTNFEKVALGDNYNNNELKAAKTLKDVQKVVDDVNVANVKQMQEILKNTNGAAKLEDNLYINLDKVTSLLDTAKEFINPTLKVNKDDKKTILETLTGELTEQIALINVINSDNTGALKSALVKLSNASEDFDFGKQVYEENILTYLNAMIDGDGKIKLTNVNVVDTKTLVNTIITEVNTANMKKSIKEIQKIYEEPLSYNAGELTDAAKAKVLKAFDNLAANSALEVNKVDATTNEVTTVNKFDKTILVDANLYEYNTVIARVNLDTVNAITTVIVNENKALAGTTVHDKLVEISKEANKANVADSDLYAALSSEVLSKQIKGLVKENAAQYGKDFEQFLQNGSVTDASYINKINNSIKVVNVRTEMLKATTVTDMLKGLNEYVVLVPGMNDIIDIQNDIAEELVLCKTGTYGKIVGFNLETVAGTNNAIATAATKRTAKLDNVNNVLEFTPAQVGTAQVGTAQVGTPQVGTAQVGTAQIGTAQVGTAQVGEVGDSNYAAASADYKAASADYKAASADYKAASDDYKAASDDYKAASDDYKAAITATEAKLTADSLELAKSLNAIDKTYTVAELAAKAQIFVSNANVKNAKGEVTGKVTYTSYAQIRAAIQKAMN